MLGGAPLFWRLEDWARVKRARRLVTLPGLLESSFIGPDRACRQVSEALVAWHPTAASAVLARHAIRLATRSIAQSTPVKTPVSMIRSLLAKAPIGPRERGLLVVSFESEIDKIARLPRFSELEREYAIAVLPSWQPFFSAPLFGLAARARQPFFVWPSSLADLDDVRYLGPMAVGQPLHASSWVDESAFRQSQARDIDLLVLANFGKYKRHWRLFEAMRDMSPSVRAVVAGRPFEGRDRAALMAEACAFGVADRVEIIVSPSDAQVSDLLGRARILCAMSHREGSFIAVAEALMAGTPVAMYSDAVIGTKDYINPKTGFLLDPTKPVGPQLQRALGESASLHPGEWARANISAQVNARRLNDLMNGYASRMGLDWTVNASPFACRNFEFHYLRTSDEQALEPQYERLRTEFGLELRRPAA